MSETPKEVKEGLVVKKIGVPGGVTVSCRPSFEGKDFIRYTKKEGELFPWITTEIGDGALWFGGTPTGWVPRSPKDKNTFYGALREEIKKTHQRKLPEPF